MGGIISNPICSDTQNERFTLLAESRLHFGMIADKYNTYEDVERELRLSGLETANLIIGIDFTKSNQWNDNDIILNPYQESIIAITSSMKEISSSGIITAFGFGDIRSQDKFLISLTKDMTGKCKNLDEVLKKYRQILPTLTLAGPTSFAPIIRKAMEIVQTAQAYHILIILADGQVTNEKETADAIVEASKLPLSIVMIGIGDGPFNMMSTFDDRLPARQFDNLNFVDFTNIRAKYSSVAFALSALMEIPEQFDYIKKNMLMTGYYKSLPIVPITVLGPEFETKSMKKKRKEVAKVPEAAKVIKNKTSAPPVMIRENSNQSSNSNVSNTSTESKTRRVSRDVAKILEKVKDDEKRKSLSALSEQLKGDLAPATLNKTQN